MYFYNISTSCNKCNLEKDIKFYVYDSLRLPYVWKYEYMRVYVHVKGPTSKYLFE